MDISVVVPLYNEVESLPELTTWISKVMAENRFTYEIILVDDGSNDGSWEMIGKLAENNPFIKATRFRRNYGKSAALNTGFAKAEGNVVITMDADLQDSPEEIPGLYRRITEDKYDLVSGWKAKRHDPLSKTIPTKLFNKVTRGMSGIHNLHDFNCGLKAYRKTVIKNIEVYGEMHRYIPVLAKWAGFTKIGEQVVEHFPRKYGKTKFGMSRFINGFLDLLSIFFVGKFAKRPMHFFGSIGVLSFLTGFVSIVWIISDKLYTISYNNTHPHAQQAYRDATEQPLFYIALAAIIIGFQLFLTGFVSELVSRNGTDRNKYQIDETI
ncbi:glycosyltransferase family 2 protein [uncultured Mucilaginibacter sp.]|uniref:glycosyltransferase family 2 protein n=1 Tax=uncultured Mucilaginibacter sp. TaxID=797541 RepID=UPI0025D2ECB8|nr:glycosyltransferase family 2 protein [uncultured Mucilaginibacter sp.]